MYRVGNERTNNKQLIIPVATGVEIVEATLVAINADGYAVPASKTADLMVAGVAQKYVDNRLGKNGDVTVEVRRGTFVLNNDNTIKNTDILKTCYVSDSTTVTIAASGSSAAGKILQVEDDGITVDIQ